MNIEIERKYLVEKQPWDNKSQYLDIKQGYLQIKKNKIVRIRKQNDDYILGFKKVINELSRYELEIKITKKEGANLFNKFCIGSIIIKRRYLISHENMIWEVDVFQGMNKGLITAEIELESEEQTFKKPNWAGEEISRESKYLNMNLAKNPYSIW
tara:strand:+ start:1330 stop:1794 length:465 start_codon:yes stop_codon:yes gene_type:complete